MSVLWLHHVLLAAGGSTGAGSYTLPASHPVNPVNTFLGALLISTLNWVLGVFGFLVIAAGMYRFLAIIWAQYSGKSSNEYKHGFVGNVSTAPKVLMAGLDVMIGIVIAGMFLSGAWVGLANGLIVIGHHITNTVSTHL